jgi:hypothetical protein
MTIHCIHSNNLLPYTPVGSDNVEKANDVVLVHCPKKKDRA